MGQGEAGARGPKGSQGDTGLRGPQGETGLRGPQGETGTMGPIGLTGTMGPFGLSGINGTMGPIGLTGTMGPMGPFGGPPLSLSDVTNTTFLKKNLMWCADGNICSVPPDTKGIELSKGYFKLGDTYMTQMSLNSSLKPYFNNLTDKMIVTVADPKNPNSSLANGFYGVVMAGNLVKGNIINGDNIEATKSLKAGGLNIVAEINALKAKTQNLDASGNFLGRKGTNQIFSGDSFSTMWDRTQKLDANGNANRTFTITGRSGTDHLFTGDSLSTLWDRTQKLKADGNANNIFGIDGRTGSGHIFTGNDLSEMWDITRNPTAGMFEILRNGVGDYCLDSNQTDVKAVACDRNSIGKRYTFRRVPGMV
jgi:hypothetical protein